MRVSASGIVSYKTSVILLIFYDPATFYLRNHRPNCLYKYIRASFVFCQAAASRVCAVLACAGRGFATILLILLHRELVSLNLCDLLFDFVAVFWAQYPFAMFQVLVIEDGPEHEVFS